MSDKPRSQMTEEDLYVRECTRQVDNIAERLDALAKHLRTTGSAFGARNLRGGAAGVAADLVNQYTNGIGNPGTFLWNMIVAARDLDEHRRSVGDGGVTHA